MTTLTATPACIAGANIRALLQQRGWTHAELARRLGMSTVAVTSYVNATRGINLNRLGEIATVFDEPIARFFEVPDCLYCGDRPEVNRICAQCGTAGPQDPPVDGPASDGA